MPASAFSHASHSTAPNTATTHCCHPDASSSGFRVRGWQMVRESSFQYEEVVDLVTQQQPLDPADCLPSDTLHSSHLLQDLWQEFGLEGHSQRFRRLRHDLREQISDEHRQFIHRQKEHCLVAHHLKSKSTRRLISYVLALAGFHFAVRFHQEPKLWSAIDKSMMKRCLPTMARYFTIENGCAVHELLQSGHTLESAIQQVQLMPRTVYQ